MNLTDTIKLLEQFAPPTIASFDHIGFLVEPNNETKRITKIGLTLDATIETINTAIRSKCDLLISHHGPNDKTFDPESRLDMKRLLLAKSKDLPIYRMHLNLDFCEGGNSETLCKLLGFNNPTPFSVRYKSQYLETGLHVVKGSFTLSNILERSRKLKPGSLRVIPSKKKVFKTIAIAPGEGFVPEFLEQVPHIDAFISGELNHIAIVRAKDLNICLIELTHASSENKPLQDISSRLSAFLNMEVQCIESSDDMRIISLNE